MRVTLLQLNSTDQIQQNILNIKNIISQHIQAVGKTDRQLFVLPENSLFFRIIEGESLKPLTIDSMEVRDLQKFCDENHIAIHFTTAMRDSDGKTYNASILLEGGEPPRWIYSKIHLFNIHLEGQKPIRESDFFEPGLEATQFEYGGFKFGSSICYDIRFAELYSQHARNKVDVILVPAAFLVKTGQAHWETLLRARAIESQAYVLAPAQVGEHVSLDGVHKRMTYGHTLAVDPWGQLIHCSPYEIGCIDVEISSEKIQQVRRQIPMEFHRRIR